MATGTVADAAAVFEELWAGDVETSVKKLATLVAKLTERLSCLERLLLVAPLEHFGKIDQAIEAMLTCKRIGTGALADSIATGALAGTTGAPAGRTPASECETSGALAGLLADPSRRTPAAKCEADPSRLLETEFSRLAEAIEAGVWESDGDNFDLYTCEEDSDDGPAGAVIVAKGDAYNRVELVHWLRGGEGAPVTRLRLRLRLEQLDAKSGGSFSLRLSHCEDLEEGALLAATFQHAVPSPEEAELEEQGDALPRPLQLQLNGKVCVDDVGELPLSADLEITLRWEPVRQIDCQFRLLPATPSARTPGLSPVAAVEGQVRADFYTAGEDFHSAKAVCLSSAGALRVRLLHLSCGAGKE